MSSVPVIHPYHAHYANPTDISVGSVTIPYSPKHKAWVLHGGDYVTNPRLVYLYAEELNKKLVLRAMKSKRVKKHYA